MLIPELMKTIYIFRENCLNIKHLKLVFSNDKTFEFPERHRYDFSTFLVYNSFH